MTIQLLRRPPLLDSESLRGYICRAATDNMAKELFAPMLTSLGTATRAVSRVAELTGCQREVLERRLTRVPASSEIDVLIRFNSTLIRKNHIQLVRRWVCPRCLAEHSLSPHFWELRQYDVCHVHGCELAGTCTRCRRQLSWSSCEVDLCSCGAELCHIPTDMVSDDRRRLCAIIASAAMYSVTSESEHHSGRAKVSGRMPTLDFVLSSIDFIVGRILPAFERVTRRMPPKGLSGMWQGLTATMLDDPFYAEYLRILQIDYVKTPRANINAAAEPQRYRAELRGCFGPGLDRLTFHRCLWAIAFSSQAELTPLAAPIQQIQRSRKRSRQRATDPGGITWRPGGRISRPPLPSRSGP